MKRIYLLLAAPLLITACQPKPSSTASAPKADSVAYPYTIKHPDQWQMDTSKANTMASLKLLQAVVKGDTAGMRKYMADSVEVNYDGGKFKGPLQKLLVIIKKEIDSTKNNVVIMQDWEAVTSKADPAQQWVTTWYKQKWTDLKGKADSADYIDDEQFKNGKMVKLDEYSRHYTKQKM